MRLLLLVPAFAVTLHAAVLGHMQPAEPLTEARIHTLPAAEQPAWLGYLTRSQKQRLADKAALAAELKAEGRTESIHSKAGHGANSMPLNREVVFYASAEAHTTAENIVSFQTPAGGWSKNIEIDKHHRQPGEDYAPDNTSQHLAPDDADRPMEPTWNYVGTLDNDATTTEIRFLAQVAPHASTADHTRYQQAIERGIRYILSAQYPNGGWPQVWPLEGGYHDAITFNDNAMINAIETLNLAVTDQNYSFLPIALREQAAQAIAHGLECILKSQVTIGGGLTIWPQQVDALTLAPAGARNYEMISLSSSESAALTNYLMTLPSPSPAVVRSVYAAAAWFQQHAISGYIYTGGKETSGGRRLFEKPGAPLLWSRYYSLDWGKPIFGDRDRTIHDELSEISEERRNGYGWYNTSANQTLVAFASWKQKHPMPRTNH
ncbi:MAG: pectate lyase [Acidobacteria bacterium]|nr:pectate lyase [Acidobacteriota bacterium]